MEFDSNDIINEEITQNSDSKKGYNPKSLENLRPFEKGVSGNPSGRPQKYAKLAKALDTIGDEIDSVWGEGETYRERTLKRIWTEACMNGSISHIKILAELGCLDDTE